MRHLASGLRRHAPVPVQGASISTRSHSVSYTHLDVYKRQPYDSRQDIAPITQLVTQPSALAVNPSLGVSTVAELVALLKKNPGKYNFASIGNGSVSHLAMEAIAIKSGVTLVHVPYPSSPQAITAVDVYKRQVPMRPNAPTRRFASICSVPDRRARA